MPLVPITDQERKRMMNELAEIDTLKTQLQEKKEKVERADFEIASWQRDLNESKKYRLKVKTKLSELEQKRSDSIKEIQGLIKNYCDNNYHFGFNKEKPKVRLHEPSFSSEEINKALEVLLSTKVTMGEYVNLFETSYIDLFNFKLLN